MEWDVKRDDARLSKYVEEEMRSGVKRSYPG
jgi:hypothetical protein